MVTHTGHVGTGTFAQCPRAKHWEGINVGQIPTTAQLVASMMHVRVDAAVDVVDVRLVVFPTSWALSFGDVSYDAVHGVACSSAVITSTDSVDTLYDVASTMVGGVKDQLASSRHYW